MTAYAIGGPFFVYFFSHAYRERIEPEYQDGKRSGEKFVA
ncbi:hypothetical protein KP78_13350 [Jeotgalibacillus soli]|uniref:Uncharacterized protein n=1 Tax=Jeotgalibacillus soli TaxID=889306 RepID=A0A0C2VLS1_9BACL|nr:hypothetical protein KP78_13350 [Jeotgalibacillus soli]